MEMNLKKKHSLICIVVFALVTMLGVITISGCASNTPGENSSSGSDSASSATINVISREDGSGTRGAFIELFGVEEEGEGGKKIDATTVNAIVTNSTSVMLTTVSSDPAAIGYISLGSLNDTVTALDIDGVVATTDNVKTGMYPIQRPFSIATKATVSDATKDFMNFIISKEGQAVIEENHYIPTMDVVQAFTSNEAEGKVVIAGSSSVSPVMEKLKEAYEAINSNVTIEIQTSDSSTGIASAAEGICDIGMTSRELKDSELSEGLVPQIIALDGIAVIVNNDNSVKSLTSQQVRDIYLGKISNWSDVSS